VAQVGEAVTQMDQATQQNAALVEESAAAAESLKLQAQQLVQVVALFQLSHGDAAAPAAKAWAPKAALTAGSIERRSPNRAKNVVRPAFNKALVPTLKSTVTVASPKPAKTGTDDWESF